MAPDLGQGQNKKKKKKNDYDGIKVGGGKGIFSQRYVKCATQKGRQIHPT
jgi:hypothetical protein